MDRKTFNMTVVEIFIQRRNKLKQYLSNVEILKDLTDYEKDQICDVLWHEVFSKDDFVIKEGEQGDRLYLVYKGNAVALKHIDNQDQVVYSYKENDYFGDLALLKNEPRAATI